MMQDAPFLSIHLGDWLVLGGLGVAIATYVQGSHKASHERDEALKQQTQMHTENKERLGVLMDFHDQQKNLNVTRDAQVTELKQQTATLMQMAAGQERRLVMLEDRNTH
jgi:hypothetical protein